MPTIRTTMRPGDEIVVSDDEYEHLLELELIYDGTPPVEPADAFDLRIASRLADEDSATAGAIKAAFVSRGHTDYSGEGPMTEIASVGPGAISHDLAGEGCTAPYLRGVGLHADGTSGHVFSVKGDDQIGVGINVESTSGPGSIGLLGNHFGPGKMLELRKGSQNTGPLLSLRNDFGGTGHVIEWGAGEGVVNGAINEEGALEVAGLDLRTATWAGRDGYTAINDRVVFAPSGGLTFGWVFMPLAEPGTHYGACILRDSGEYKLQALAAEGDLGMVHLREPIHSIPGDSVYDPCLLPLPNGTALLGFHSGDEGKLYFFRSTNRGSSWTQVSTIDAGDPLVTHRRFSEIHMVRSNLGAVYTGTATRIVAVWCDIDPVPPAPSREAVIVSAFSDDEGATWSAPVVVTPTSGSASTGILSDNTRPWLFQDGSGNLNLLYSRVIQDGTITVASIWQTVLSSDGATVVTPPVKVIDCPFAESLMTRPDHPGAAPAVFAGRDGQYHLVWSESNYAANGADGIVNIMSGDGTPGGWQNKTTLIHRTDAPDGFGRVQPVRVGGTVELLYGYVNTPTTSQLRALTLSGL